MANSPIQLVVFDLGRVLVQIADDWHHAASVAGLDDALPDLDPIGRAVLHELVVLCEIGAISHDLFCIRAGHVMNVKPAVIQQVSDAYLLGAYRGADVLISAVQASGLKTACLTNTNDNHWRLMLDPTSPAYVPLDRLHYRFASHLAKVRKPEDAIFEFVEHETGMKPDEILFFDDSPENIASAETQGWACHRVLDRDDPITEMRAIMGQRGLLKH